MEKFLSLNKKDNLETNDFKYNKYKKLGLSRINRDQNLRGILLNNNSNSFEKGLFRIHTIGSSYFWTEVVTEYFKNYKNKIYCFGFDWMGRQFAVNMENRDLIYMFDYATGEDFVMEQTLSGFFDEDLAEDREETLAIDLFESFLKEHEQEFLKFNECISFKQPLFLGGKDDIKNMETGDIEVNWEISYQLFCKAKGLPNNTLINNITLED